MGYVALGRYGNLIDFEGHMKDANELTIVLALALKWIPVHL